MNKHKALKQKYIEDVLPKLAVELAAKNSMSLPGIEKIVVNMGTGERLRDKAAREKLVAELAAITGQKPKVQEARMSVSGFGVREGMPVGLTVTLRRSKMYDFLERLIAVVLPRFRDFRGLPLKSFDKGGNYTLGVVEHTVFPEIDLAKTDRPHGLEITMVIKNSNPQKSRLLLELMGVPFEKRD